MHCSYVENVSSVLRDIYCLLWSDVIYQLEDILKCFLQNSSGKQLCPEQNQNTLLIPLGKFWYFNKGKELASIYDGGPIHKTQIRTQKHHQSLTNPSPPTEAQ